MRGPQRSFGGDVAAIARDPGMASRARAAIGHMPFKGHRTVAQWDRPCSPPKKIHCEFSPVIRKRGSDPFTFEEQMEAVRNGAPLVDNRPIRRANPTMTLGGVVGEIM